MIEFRYVRISESFVGQIRELAWKGESLVFLGPRNVGKRYLIRRLLDDPARPPGGRVALVSFLTPMSDEHDHHASGLVNEFPGLDRLQPSPSAAVAWVDGQLRATEGQVTLFAANVDALTHSEIQEFLYHVRTRVEGRGPGPGRLAVVLTGEVDLSRFIHGPLSQFTCGNQFVVQGFAREEFEAFARHYIGLLGPSIELIDGRILGQLYDRTGGSTYLLRLILWSIFDRHASAIGSAANSVTIACLPEDTLSNQPPWNYFLRYLTRLVDSDPDCWPDLERLLAGKEVPVPGIAPHPLELAGIAARERGRIIMPETLIRDFIRRHYTARRFADLYAREADWREAFDRYRHLAPADRCRPSDIEDLADTEEVVRHLRTSLYHEATRGTDAVLRRFCDGCRSVMGFPEVTRWRFADGGWSAILEPIFDDQPVLDRPESSVTEVYRTLLDTIPPEGQVGPVAIDSAHQSRLIAFRIPTSHPDLSEVVVVGWPGSRNILSRASQRMLGRLIGDFLAAYGHALEDQRALDREKFREEFTAIVSEIVERLGTEIRDVDAALKRAAELLRTRLAYKRVCVSVIDPKRLMTVPVVLEKNPGVTSVENLAEYSYRLDYEGPSATIWAVKERRPLVLRDATTAPEANNEAAKRLGITGVAVIPLIDPKGEVVGVVQIERDDGRTPTANEVEALFDFSKNLAVALQLNEQVAMLQTALDTLPRPIAIFDRDGLTRYLNKQASGFLDREAKWYPAGTGPHYRELAGPDGAREFLRTFFPLLEEALARCERQSARRDITINLRSFHLDAMVEPIWDWRRKFDSHGLSKTDLMTGVLFHSQDMTYLSRVFQALGLLIAADGREQVIQQTIEAIRHLGHRWCGLYGVDPANPTEMVSRTCFGFTESDRERQFHEGGFRVIAADDPCHWRGWRCIAAKHPIVFHHDPQREDGERIPNESGLVAENCKNMACSPEVRIEPGQYCIDFPLVAPGRVFGKLTIECGAGRSPEDLRSLSVLCDLTSLLLAEAMRRENDLENKDRLYREAARKALHTELHEIKRRPSELQQTLIFQQQLIGDLRREMAGCGASEASPRLLDDFEAAVRDARDICNEIVNQIDQAKKHFQIDVKPVRTDLIDLIRGVLPTRKETYSVRPGEFPDSFPMDLDGDRFRRILKEMFSNAGRFPRERAPVEVTIHIQEMPRDGTEWVRIVVADNGAGIPADIRPRIFEENFTTSKSDGHDGWGLFEAFELIARHRGTLREEGTAGVGATFVIELPRYQGP